MPMDREFPGEIEKIRTWFQDYKIPDGKPANVFGYDNKVCHSVAASLQKAHHEILKDFGLCFNSIL